MSSVIPLGTFARVPLTHGMADGGRRLTPWLASEPNIKGLGDALGLDLEVEAVEHWVGSFRADILARVQDEADHRVLIENQLVGPTTSTLVRS